MAETYSLLIQNTEGISKIPGGLHGTPKLYVAVDLDGSCVFKTHNEESTLSPRWDFTGNICADLPSANLTVEVHHKGVFDTLIGRCHTTIGELLQQSGANTVVKLDIKRKGSISGHIFLRLSHVSTQELQEAATRAVQRMRGDVENIERSPGNPRVMGIANAAIQAEAMADNFQPLLSKLLSQLEPIVEMGDEIAKIHPYINIAWKVLTSVYKVMEKQRNTDEKIVKLVQAMVQLYSSVGDMDFVRDKINSLENVVLEIAAQTLECSLFIREYTGHGFSGRLLQAAFSGMETKIESLSDVLMKLKDSFDRGVIIQSVFLSAKMNEKVQGLVESDLLQSLKPAQYNAALRDECLHGTRKDLLTEITEQLSSTTTASDIIWLYGVAGSGKSAIANTVAQYFRTLHRLGAFIFFDRDNPSTSDIRGVLHHIAHRIAESNIHVRKAICDALCADATLVDADYRTQFQRLLLDPLIAAAPYIFGPIVIIVDALDECLDSTSRKALLSLIAGDMAKLPPAVRLFITSRPDSDITRVLRAKSHVASRQLDITTEDTKRDIYLYLHQCMQNLRIEWPDLEPQWPEERNIQLLATYTGGLFIWAATAYKFLQNFDPQSRLTQLLDAGEIINSNLDQLYCVALEHTADWSDSTFSSSALSILACVVLSREPLTVKTLISILDPVLEGLKVAKALQYLACVLQYGPGAPIRTLHASFSDYVVDSRRSRTKPWFVDIQLQSQFLATRCFQVLATKLQFNICGIETSHLRNSDLSDLSGRIERHIPEDLRYASHFWAHHLQAATASSGVLDRLRQFTSHYFLYWLEVLSLLGEVSEAHGALEIAERYAQGKDQDLTALLHDGMKFIAGFAPAIAQSMPHLYVSALAMAPRESVVRQHYKKHFRRTMQYEAAFADTWGSLIKVLPDQGSVVSSVAFSHDNARIVCGSHDGMVRIWKNRSFRGFSGCRKRVFPAEGFPLGEG
ncbi:hypothetical protein R3P38DRAFT_2671185 [Favolaschia claudopus]|uniref:C2 domain-containing protein n=1 Tax=Favolaschia claudopus TaxID=2862362 RepID=A0AAV9Z2P4_9AGAR